MPEHWTIKFTRILEGGNAGGDHFDLQYCKLIALWRMENSEIERFLSTWGPHCGAPKAVFEGHLRKMIMATVEELKEKFNTAAINSAAIYTRALDDAHAARKEARDRTAFLEVENAKLEEHNKMLRRICSSRTDQLLRHGIIKERDFLKASDITEVEGPELGAFTCINPEGFPNPGGFSYDRKGEEGFTDALIAKVTAKLRSMTPAEAKEHMVKAGIIDRDGHRLNPLGREESITAACLKEEKP